MGYERYGQDDGDSDYYGGRSPQDYGRDYGAGRDYSYSSARDYGAAGMLGGNRDRGQSYGRGGQGGFGGGNDRGNRDFGGGSQGNWRGSSMSDGRRETEYGDERGYGRREQSYGRDDDRSYGSRESYGRDQNRGYGFGDSGRGREFGGRDYGRRDHDDGRRDRPSEGYRYEDRGFMARAGDEVRSWFGDEDAERRRERDARMDERQGGGHHDADYHNWRRGQISSLDRDYHEYRQENASRFENEFNSWRTERQTQRSSLTRVKEHMEVVGSDGQHVGTVDKVRGDRIILTKNDADAGGHHHSIPSRWIDSVDDKVKIRKTAEEAQSHWRNEEQNNAFFGSGDQNDTNRNKAGSRDDDQQDRGAHVLNRSFPGTY